MPTYVYQTTLTIAVEADDENQAADLIKETQSHLRSFEAVRELSDPTFLKKEDDERFFRRLMDSLNKIDLHGLNVREVRMCRHDAVFTWRLYFILGFIEKSRVERDIALITNLVDLEIFDYQLCPEEFRGAVPPGMTLWSTQTSDSATSQP